MERETKEIITPINKIKVVLKSWLTGRERRAIRSVLLEEIKFEQDKDGETISGYNIHGSVLDKAQDKALETVIVSINDVTEDVANIALDMHDTDFDFIVKEIDKITGGIDEEDKKK